TAWRSRSASTLLNRFADRVGQRFGRLRARDAELVLEDEGRHGRDAEVAHRRLALGDRLRIGLRRPALHPGARGDRLQDVGMADIARLLEVGVEQRIDGLASLALRLR